MKHLLTSPSQSATLVAKGISADNASIRYAIRNRELTPRIFTLADLCSLLPKEIGTDTLYMEYLSDGRWEVGYRGERKTHSILEFVIENELVDALYELLCRAIDNKHVKLD